MIFKYLVTTFTIMSHVTINVMELVETKLAESTSVKPSESSINPKVVPVQWTTYLADIDKAKILDVVKTMPIKNSSGLDGIPIKVLKNCCSCYCPSVVFFSEFIDYDGCFLLNFKVC
nr:unnamed protein product [Callosobruchus analis]